MYIMIKEYCTGQILLNLLWFFYQPTLNDDIYNLYFWLLLYCQVRRSLSALSLRSFESLWLILLLMLVDQAQTSHSFVILFLDLFSSIMNRDDV